MKPLQRALAGASLAIVVASRAFCQPAAPEPTRPAFEVAEVKVNKSGAAQMQANFLPSGQIVARNIPMKLLIAQAYNLRNEYVTGGPGWLDEDRFDIIAKAAPGSSTDAMREMLQVLLADRFRLAIHREQKDMPIYALVPSKQGPKLKPAAGAGAPKCTPNSITDGKAHRTCTNFNMDDLAHTLPQLAPFYFDRVVVNLTGIEGTYDIQLDWTVRPPSAPPGPPQADGNLGVASDVAAGSTIFDSVEKQLGLKLDSRKHPMTVIVIDRVERTPTDN